MKTPADTDHPITSARKRRVDLKAAMSEVEVAAASPTGDPGWRIELGEAVAGLIRSWDEHVVEVESPTGILAQIVETAPRVVSKVKRLEREHVAITERLANLGKLAAATTSEGELRNDILDVLVELARHRQRGADVVYEAYEVDIGGE